VIGQVAKENGVSIRMLRYYEEIGLTESQRKEGSAYYHMSLRLFETLAGERLTGKPLNNIQRLTEFMSNKRISVFLMALIKTWHCAKT